MNRKLENYKRYIFIGIIIIALRITFNTTSLKGAVSPLGAVFIAICGLFFIIGMSKKREESKK